jgi:hypothetical protein
MLLRGGSDKQVLQDDEIAVIVQQIGEFSGQTEVSSSGLAEFQKTLKSVIKNGQKLRGLYIAGLIFK